MTPHVLPATAVAGLVRRRRFLLVGNSTTAYGGLAPQDWLTVACNMNLNRVSADIHCGNCVGETTAWLGVYFRTEAPDGFDFPLHFSAVPHWNDGKPWRLPFRASTGLKMASTLVKLGARMVVLDGFDHFAGGDCNPCHDHAQEVECFERLGFHNGVYEL